jgi:hypothetical protein
MEKIDMPLFQCQQIRERFLVNARQYFLDAETPDNRPGADFGRKHLASSPGDSSPCIGRSDE